MFGKNDWLKCEIFKLAVQNWESIEDEDADAIIAKFREYFERTADDPEIDPEVIAYARIIIGAYWHMGRESKKADEVFHYLTTALNDLADDYTGSYPDPMAELLDHNSIKSLLSGNEEKKTLIKAGWESARMHKLARLAEEYPKTVKDNDLRETFRAADAFFPPANMNLSSDIIDKRVVSYINRILTIYMQEQGNISKAVQYESSQSYGELERLLEKAAPKYFWEYIDNYMICDESISAERWAYIKSLGIDEELIDRDEFLRGVEIGYKLGEQALLQRQGKEVRTLAEETGESFWEKVRPFGEQTTIAVIGIIVGCEIVLCKDAAEHSEDSAAYKQMRKEYRSLSKELPTQYVENPDELFSEIWMNIAEDHRMIAKKVLVYLKEKQSCNGEPTKWKLYRKMQQEYQIFPSMLEGDVDYYCDITSRSAGLWKIIRKTGKAWHTTLSSTGEWEPCSADFKEELGVFCRKISPREMLFRFIISGAVERAKEESQW